MKHLLSTALLCGFSILGMQAQNIIVVDKDGVSHRYHADYVKDITFEKIQAQATYNVAFETVAINPYGSSNIGVTLSTPSQTLELDLYQPAAKYLQPGTYTVQAGNGDNTIDPGQYSSFTTGGNKLSLSAGTVKITLDDETYTFDADLTLTNGETLKGTYTGKLDTFGPVLNFDLTGCAWTSVNNPADNGFYYKFNDAAYKLEMRIDLFNSGNAIANGTYNFATTAADGTASSAVSLYSPYNDETTFTSGTVTLAGEGSDRTVTIDGTLGNGLKMKATYTGSLPARPAAGLNMTFSDVEVMCYDLRNEGITLRNGLDQMQFDFWQPSALYFQPGTYTVQAGNADFTIDPAYSKGTLKGKAVQAQSGTVTVALDGDTYTFTADVALTDGSTLKGTYTGELYLFGPTMNLDFTDCRTRNNNNPDANGHYYILDSDDPTTETRLDLFTDAATPAEGTYTIADTKANGTAVCNIELYSPWNQATTLKEGTVTVSASKVEIKGVMENGLKLNAAYNYSLPK